MQSDHQAQVAFFLTGARAAGRLEALEPLALRPALFSSYRDLSGLRYDYPLVLARNAPADECIQSLSALVDGALAGADASTLEGARLRKRVLRVEQTVRKLLAEGARGTLGELWDKALARLSEAERDFGASVEAARAAIKVDGELLECAADTPTRVFMHAWQALQEEKARRFEDVAGRLALKLSDLLKADLNGSAAGRTPERLAAAMGTSFRDEFDYKALSRVLASVSPKATLDAKRRRRIERLLGVLQSQPFHPGAARKAGARKPAYRFVFETCAAAVKALAEHRASALELTRAIAMAELEVKGEYDEARHEAFFAAWRADGLERGDAGLLPDYLVCLDTLQAAEQESLLALLASGAPVKALVRFDDLVERSPLSGAAALSLRSRQLADAAIGLGNVFVMQSSASHLLQFRDRIARGLAYPGPALFSVYSGAGDAKGVAPYLAAAAAMESRVFPAFVYDPSAGADWASRFQVDRNPQAERDWVKQSFLYEDEAHQRVEEDLDFTLADFLACDPRFSSHYARVPRANWNGILVPLRECIAGGAGPVPEKVPYLLMTDASDRLHKVIVDERLVQEARRCSQAWRSLQELGGIRNSHAERLLAREKAEWEAQKQRELEAVKRDAKPAAAAVAPAAALVPAAAPAPAVAPAAGPATSGAAAAAAPGAAAAAAPAAEPAAQASSDEPWIETPRCTTCEECVRINNRMFMYDGNKQAYIADVNAGTYRELVEAAENCQVSIIHPGKPKNPNEPGLEELIARAEVFQ